MNNGLLNLEDEMYRLYLTFFPKGKAVKTGFDALSSKIINLISQYPEETAHVLASGTYRLTRRMFSQPFIVKRHQPRSLIRLRPARTHVYTYQSHQDLAHAIRHAIDKPADPQILRELACLTFKSINQPTLNLDLDFLRESSESLVVKVSRLRKAFYQPE